VLTARPLLGRSPACALFCSLLWAVLAVGPVGAASPWLEVDAPRETETRVDRSMMEVRGHGGNRRGPGHDVVIVIDLSESTLEGLGVDLDGDGPEGGSDPELVDWLENQLGSTRLVERLRDEQDFDDTVLAAELAAARALVESLDLGRFRVGIVGFADGARVLAPLGSSRERLSSPLRDLEFDFHHDMRGTNFAAAVREAHAMLVPDREAPPDARLRSIVFLSDGAPTRPVLGDRAERYAMAAALEAGADGVRLYAFAIGPEAEAGLAVMEKMAVWTSGRLETVARPEQIVARLRRLDLVDLSELSVVNDTTGSPARALRSFPDGSFDAFVELAPGRNLLRFEARGPDGSVHRVDRWVTFVASALPDVAAGPDPLVEQLRQRTAELEALAEMQRERQRRELELRVEEEAPAPAAGDVSAEAASPSP
jgi:hypothetical protein